MVFIDETWVKTNMAPCAAGGHEGLTPYEFICKMWTKEPQRFKLNPIHQTLGPNT